jgi:hypothetical protein
MKLFPALCMVLLSVSLSNSHAKPAYSNQAANLAAAPNKKRVRNIGIRNSEKKDALKSPPLALPRSKTESREMISSKKSLDRLRCDTWEKMHHPTIGPEVTRDFLEGKRDILDGCDSTPARLLKKR